MNQPADLAESVPKRRQSGVVRTTNQQDHLVSALLQLAADVSKGEPRTDFVSGYDWADIHDKRDEGLSLA